MNRPNLLPHPFPENGVLLNLMGGLDLPSRWQSTSRLIRFEMEDSAEGAQGSNFGSGLLSYNYILQSTNYEL